MSQKKAFTLIELLVVVAIIGVITGIVVVQMNNSVNAGKDAKREADINLIANAVVSYSSEHYSAKPASAAPCTIGGTCPSSINNSLQPYLAALPSDPNSGTYYTYQSDGNNCTVSAVLSNGQVYQYSCGTVQAAGQTSTGTPTNGVCGSANTTYAPGTTTFGSNTFCSSGTANPASPVFPVTDGTSVSWVCPGTYLGNDTPCAAYRGLNGVCGSVTTTTITAYTPATNSWPSSNYCSAGTVSPNPTFPSQGSSTSWTCSHIYSGADAPCIAYRGQDGACGSSSPNGNFKLSTDITNTCSAGTVSTITGSTPYTGYWKWTCSGIYTGVNSSQCTANKMIDGACGTANGQTYSAAPSGSILCVTGTNPTSVTGSGSPSGYWKWGCAGINGGTNTGGTTPATGCSANTQTMCGGHNAPQCIAANGTLVSIGSCYICKFPLAACPSGWAPSGTYGWKSVPSQSETLNTVPCLANGVLGLYASGTCSSSVSLGWSDSSAPIFPSCCADVCTTYKLSQYCCYGCSNTGDYGTPDYVGCQ